MSASPAPTVPAARVAGRDTHVAVPLRSLARTELRLHVRHHVLSAVVGLTAVWVALLLAVPDDVRPNAVAWVLFLDLATFGFFFVPALTVVERGNGVTAALGLTRLSPARALLVRVGLMAAWSLGAAVAVVAAGRPPGAVGVVVAAVLTTILLSLLAVVMVGRHDTLTGYLPRVPAVGIPLLVPALVHGIGLWDAPVLWVSPATGALALLAGQWSWLAVGWLLLWTAGVWVAAVRIGFDVDPGSRRRRGSPRRRPTPRPAASSSSLPGRVRRASRLGRTRTAVAAFARADRRTLLGDGMLVLLVAGVPLLALIVRLATGPGVAWVRARHGIDVTPHLPAFWALVVVLHTPTMAGALCGLLFLEDRDAGLLPVIATTRASLRTLVGYRLGATAVGTAGAVLVALVLAGARHEAGAGGLVATAVVAAAASAVPAVLMATFARDRVAGMALMKVMGLPLYLPLAWWFVDGPAGWVFAVVPTGWAARAFWAPSTMAAAGFAAGGVALSVLLVAAMLSRLQRSVAV